MKRKEKIKPLISEDQIKKRIAVLAKEISLDLKANKITELQILCLLKGSFIYSADLIRQLHRYNVTPKIDFINVSSYGAAKVSSGKIKVNGRLSEEVRGKNVLIVDDILESGNTLHFISSRLKKEGAKKIMISVLLEKKGKLEKPVKADFVGFKIPDKFVVGYGLDYAGSYRELPFIAEIID